MKNFIKLNIILIIFTISSCKEDKGNVYVYPLVVEKYHLYSKFDSAAYLIYMLNIVPYLNIHSTENDKQYARELLSAQLSESLIHYSKDTCKITFLLLNKNGDIIYPSPTQYLINTIGFVKDSIKFIEINDGALMKIKSHSELAFDSIFLRFVHENSSYLSKDIKRVLK